MFFPAAQQCGAGFFIALFSGAGNDKPIYQIADHLGSVRVIKDGNGDVLQRFDYYPFGGESRVWTAGTSTPQSALRYRFGGKEIAGQTVGASAFAGIPAAAAGSPYLDFGARLYDPRTAAWLSQDPMAEKYYPISPYVYCAGNPVNLVDIRGLEVLPRSAIELEIIRNTLPEDARLFVQLNENGLIDKELLSQYPRDNFNVQNLSDLVYSEKTIAFSVSDHFDYYDSHGLFHDDGRLSYGGYDEAFKDINFESVSGLTTGEMGNYGKTLFPDLNGLQNSSSNSIEIYLHPSLSVIGAAEAFSHEGYGHALLYVRNGYDHNGASHQPVGMHDTNTILVKMILKARQETVKNVQP